MEQPTTEELLDAVMAVLMDLGWRERYAESKLGPIHTLDRLMYAITGEYNAAAYFAVEGVPSWVEGE